MRDHEQYDTVCDTQGLPAQFVALVSLLSGQMQRVLKYKLGRLEAHAMFFSGLRGSSFRPR